MIIIASSIFCLCCIFVVIWATRKEYEDDEKSYKKTKYTAVVQTNVLKHGQTGLLYWKYDINQDPEKYDTTSQWPVMQGQPYTPSLVKLHKKV